ncbi:PREDICTED: tudor domain-containing protein 5 isoform X2 [Gavialis gangeticus]|uniref:tudor domain-containing protein 5 isoform X2 n=1 Tax=Gavialis gangeticus TaxID=94835 RepID=UPI00092F405D|nr:PREDICTED: tudor domain-containing protein 5 isoform X2 [Gavialis gangeticus]
MRYGFFSMFEVLNAASEIIAVEQTRAGSLLTLKKSPSVKQQEKVLEDDRVSQPKRAKKPKSSSVPAPAFGKPSPELGTKKLLQAPKPSSEPVDAQVLNYDNRMKQLEQDFKMTLAQKGPGGTVSSELKRRLQTVVAQYPEGLFVSRLPGEFEAHFKEKLSVKELGFFNVMELVGALHDIFHVECKEGERDWMVFDLKSKCLKDNDPSVDEVDKHDALALSLPPAAELKASSWDSSAKETEALDLKKVSVFKVVTKVVKQNLDIEAALLNLEIMEPEIPPDAVQDKNLCGLPPLENSSLVGVFVEHIVSPSQFYIRTCSKETSEMLEDTMIEMRRCYSNKTVSNRYVMPEALIQPGCLCCVRISEDKWWYRVIVHRVLSEQEVEVFYPDFGNLGTVQKSWLRFLKCCYSKLPAQAIPCSLAWVKPLEGTWTSKAVLRFQKLCSLKPLVGVVDEYVNGVLHLFLCDTSSDDDIYLHHVLRSEGHAIICRENFPSKAFEELNPSALYIKPSLEQNAGSAGQDFHSQQQKCISTVHGTANPEIGESESHDQDVGNFPLELPYLEPVTACTDIWDENWLPLQTPKKQTNMGPNTVDTVVSSNQIPSNQEQDQIQESKELLTQTPDSFGESSDPASLSKSQEEFYISLIHSQQPAEPSQAEFGWNEVLPGSAQCLTAAPASTSCTAVPLSLDKLNDEVIPEGVKNEDLSGTQTFTLCSKTSLPDQGTVEQNPPFLAAELQAFQRLYIPRSLPTAVLGAAARLATSSGHFCWFPGLRKMDE